MRDAGSDKRTRVVVAAVVVVYAALRLGIWLDTGWRSFGDTITFDAVADEPFWSKGFWAGHKPWVLPAVFKPLQGNDARTLLNLVCSMGAWGFLAVVAGRAQRTRLVQWTVAVAILVFSLTPSVSLWDRAVLSESLALSVTAVVTALSIAFVRRPSVAAAAALGVVLFVWVGTRDTFGQLALVLGVTAAVAAFTAASAHRTAWLCFAAAAVLVGAFGSWSAFEGDRNDIPLFHVVGGRVLATDDGREFFAKRGMPVDAATVELAKTWNRGDHSPWYTAAETEPARAWIRRHGASAYAAYLASRPVHTVADVLAHAENVLGNAERRSALKPEWYAAGRPSIFSIPGRLLYPPGAWAAVVLWAVAAALALWAGGRRALAAPTTKVAVGAFVFAWIVAALGWHTDAIEMPRHAVAGAVWLRLSTLLLVAAALDTRHPPPRLQEPA